MSSAMTRRSRSDSGTSPATMRWARPSTIAVLPTPGSPISTGLFFVRRQSTWMTRRISSSRPMTGSSLPSRAAGVRSRPYFSSAWNLSSGVWSVTRCAPRTSASACEQALARGAGGAQRLAGGAACSASASRRCSTETYSSLSARISARPRGGRTQLGAAPAARPRLTWAARRSRVRARRAARRPTPSLPQDGATAALLLEQDDEQVLGRHLRVAALVARRRRPRGPPGS